MNLVCSKRNFFCYICGKWAFEKTKRNITERLEQGYEQYFGMEIIKNAWYVPEYCCNSCYRALYYWIKRERKSMPFGIPMIWFDPVKHNAEVCYFCINSAKISSHNKKTIQHIEYSAVPSIQFPKPHSENVPIPEFPEQINAEYEDDFMALNLEEGASSSSLSEYSPSVYAGEPNHPILMDQAFLNDLIRDLHLSKQLAELLGSRLQERHLLEPGVKVTLQRKRQQSFQGFFECDEQNNIVLCNDINGLMNLMGIEHEPTEWRLFIDSSKNSLKTVLLNNGNKHPSIPVAYGVGTKENYETFKIILGKSLNFKSILL